MPHDLAQQDASYHSCFLAELFILVFSCASP
jgi:hypothetical protein